MAINIIYNSIPETSSRLLQNLLGKKFGAWTVVEYIGKTKNGTSIWNCHCGYCGTIKPVDTASLNRGHSNHCGCKQKENFIERSTKHGLFGTDIYGIWAGIIQRCENKKYHNYSRYGGRGISMCHEWRESVEKFAKDMGPRPYGFQIDRIDNDGNYEPSNCRWVTCKQNCRNRSNNTKIEFNGEKLTAQEIAEKLGLPARAFANRIYRGVSVADAIKNSFRSDAKD